jgi:Zn-dependent protease with chaperone function
MIAARYFDGRSARSHQVELAILDGKLTLSNAELNETYPLADVELVEPFAGAPSVVNVPGGAYCEVHGAEDKQVLHDALAFRKSFVMRLQERWISALCAVVALCGVLFATVEWGIPALAERIVAMAPASLDKALGQQTLAALEHELVKPSRLSDQRIAEVQAVFNNIKPAGSRQPLQMLVRAVPGMGPNAFALPDGTIVMTDEMVKKIVGNGIEVAPYHQQQLTGVFAHEIGHVQGRHSMRIMARSSLTVALAATMFGDFSAVASGIPAILMKMQHSREMETEADNYAIRLMAEHQMPTAPLAALFQTLMDENKSVVSKLPRWMRTTLGYASSHPSTIERIRLLNGPVSVDLGSK